MESEFDPDDYEAISWTTITKLAVKMVFSFFFSLEIKMS